MSRQYPCVVAYHRGGLIGDNDVRLSDMGPDGDADFGATHPAVTANTSNGEYLVVWSGDDNTGGLVKNEREVFGQFYQTDPPSYDIRLPVVWRDS